MNVHWSVWEHTIPPVKNKDSKIHIERPKGEGHIGVNPVRFRVSTSVAASVLLCCV